MNPFRTLRRLWRKKSLEAEMAGEMRLHLEHRADEYVQSGLPADEARYAALRRFGGVEQAKERCRDARGAVACEQWLRDARHAVRSLLRTPGFTAMAIVTLALGIGLNVAMFSLTNALVLRPLPYADGERLVRLYRASPQHAKGGFSRADYLDLKAAERGYGQFAAYYHSSVSLAEPGQPPEWQNTLRVAADFLPALGVKSLLGRLFRPEEERYGQHRVLVVTHAFWQERLGGDPDVVGRTVRCNGEPHEIVGVLPPEAFDRRIFGNARLLRRWDLPSRNAPGGTSRFSTCWGSAMPSAARRSWRRG